MVLKKCLNDFQASMQNKKRFFIAVMIPLFFLTVFYIKLFNLQGSMIADGVKAEDIDIGGLRQDQAKERLKAYVKKVFNKPVILTFKNNTWVFVAADNGFSLDIDGTVKNALNVGRRGLSEERWLERMRVGKNGLTLGLRIIENKPKWDVFIQMLSQQINRPAVSADIAGMNGNSLVVTPESDGYRLQEKQLKRMLLNAVCIKGPRSIEVPVLIERPKLTGEDIEKNQFQRIGTFSTVFDDNFKERMQNILLAAQSINGTVLLPGETFSYNQIVGLREGNRGFLEAPVITNGELVSGVGGGVCQVSSTIYSAALYARLEILTRQNHSRVVPYIPLGQDATVLDNQIDLEFKNNQSSPLIINCSIIENVIRVDIWGQQLHPNEEVKLFSKVDKIIPFPIIEKNDPTLHSPKRTVEKKGVDGYEVSLYRVIIKDKKEIKKEFIDKSYYVAIPEIVRIRKRM